MCRTEQQHEWNQFFARSGTTKPRYDDWLVRFEHIPEYAKTSFIADLGCGTGNDTLYLTEKGYDVILRQAEN